MIEGAKLTVCNNCSKHGKSVWEEEPRPKPLRTNVGAQPPFRVPSEKTARNPLDLTMQLVEDFDTRIRLAREKRGYSHEELGKKTNEKVSLLRKIETRKMMPDNTLATKLEHVLKIKLIIPVTEEKIEIPQSKMAKSANRELTLGDLVQLGKRGKDEKEDVAERKR
jgi:putative transcription factor